MGGIPVRGASHLDGRRGQQSGLGGNIDVLQNEDVGNKDAAVGKSKELEKIFLFFFIREAEVVRLAVC